jgi:hypothetical protein
MITLHPIPETTHSCPYCQTLLTSVGWHIPGMRNLADLQCSECQREFYGDLPSGQGLYTPMLLEKSTGVVHDPYNVVWFAEWLKNSYAARVDTPIPFEVQQKSLINRHVVILNCLDTLYGHSLLKLLNAQYYLDRRNDIDLIIIAPRNLEWMIPEGVAEAWVVDLPLSRGTEWNEWLAREIHRRVKAFPAASLSVAFSHPHPRDFQIERFTRVKPFPLDEWSTQMDHPVVTFIWREDRLWLSDSNEVSRPFEKIARVLNGPAVNGPGAVKLQAQLVIKLENFLRQMWPSLDFAVVGMGQTHRMPGSINDLRQTSINSDIERKWCQRYASSHVVVGVHGSNMLLPSAHAGSVVELLGQERWGNFLQDILFQDVDSRETLFRYRFLPDTTSAETLAQLLSSLMLTLPKFRALMGRDACDHQVFQSPG